MLYFKLKNGIEIPSIGFGPGIMGYTTKIQKRKSLPIRIVNRLINRFIYSPLESEKYIKSITSAFHKGYRLLDYSCSYGNMKLIGEAIKKSAIDREKLIITSRVSNQAQINHTVKDEFIKSLRDMGLEYVDILQFHWPVTDCYVDTWKEMIRLRNEGYCKVLGVANCNQHHIENLYTETGELPLINQFEVHPLFTQKPLIEYCKTKGIQVEAYTPIARYDARLVRLPLLKRLEKKYNKSFIQIILRWHIQNGLIPVIRSLNAPHQKTNIDVYNFELSDEDMHNIDSININSRLRYDPDNCDFSIL